MHGHASPSSHVFTVLLEMVCSERGQWAWLPSGFGRLLRKAPSAAQQQ
jgi:hypothetical protein